MARESQKLKVIVISRGHALSVGLKICATYTLPPNFQVITLMDGWMDGWMDGQMMDGQTDRQTKPLWSIWLRGKQICFPLGFSGSPHDGKSHKLMPVML